MFAWSFIYHSVQSSPSNSGPAFSVTPCHHKRLHQTPIGIAADETRTHSRLGNGLYAMYSAPTLPLRPACCRQWPAITFASLRFYSRHIVIFCIFTIVIIHDSINASLPYQELNSSQFLSNVGLQTLFSLLALWPRRFTVNSSVLYCSFSFLNSKLVFLAQPGSSMAGYMFCWRFLFIYF